MELSALDAVTLLDMEVRQMCLHQNMVCLLFLLVQLTVGTFILSMFIMAI